MTDLLPCPFCGTEAKIVIREDGTHYVGCSSRENLSYKCFCPRISGKKGDLYADIKAWNTRASTPTLSPVSLAEDVSAAWGRIKYAIESRADGPTVYAPDFATIERALTAPAPVGGDVTEDELRQLENDKNDAESFASEVVSVILNFTGADHEPGEKFSADDLNTMLHHHAKQKKQPAVAPSEQRTYGGGNLTLDKIEDIIREPATANVTMGRYLLLDMVDHIRELTAQQTVGGLTDEIEKFFAMQPDKQKQIYFSRGRWTLESSGFGPSGNCWEEGEGASFKEAFEALIQKARGTK